VSDFFGKPGDGSTTQLFDTMKALSRDETRAAIEKLVRQQRGPGHYEKRPLIVSPAQEKMLIEAFAGDLEALDRWAGYWVWVADDLPDDTSAA
jgi:hypothetical protein